MKRKKLQKDRKNATENKLKEEWVKITLRSLIDVPPPLRQLILQKFPPRTFLFHTPRQKFPARTSQNM